MGAFGSAAVGSGAAGARPADRVLLSYLGLSALAVGLPLVQMTARAPEFFAGHGLAGTGIVAFVLVVTVLPALLFAACVAGVRRVWPDASAFAHRAATFVLLLIALCGWTSRLGVLGLVLAVPLAAWMALVSTRPGAPAKLARALVAPAWLAVAAVVVGSPLRVLVAPAAAGDPGRKGGSALATDVVLLLFDELPLVSLLDERGKFDSRRAPSFAKLAAGATWYPNAASTGTHTSHAIAGLLGGNLADGGAPTARAYPDNLMAWMAKTHTLYVHESGTDFCGARCGRREVHLDALAADVAILLGRATIPARLAGWLPATDGAFSDFAGLRESGPETRAELYGAALRALRADRARVVREFVAGLAAAPRPLFAYLHAAVPHGPFRRLPSGATYPGVEQLRGDEIDDVSGTRIRRGAAAAADHRYHRHLLQAGFADRLLGEVIAELERLDRLRGALVIVASDHGRSFQLDEGPRGLTGGNLADVLNVPLVVKLPRQERGVVDGRHTTLLDVPATVARVLGSQLPWSTEGIDLGSAPVSRDHFRVYDSGKVRRVSFEDLARQREAAIARLWEWFRYDDSGGLVRNVAPEIPLGSEVERSLASADFEYDIDQAALLADVRPDSGFVPAEITGRVRGEVPSTLALIVGDRVAARTAVYEADGEMAFAAMVPEPLFRPGRNRVRLARVDADADGAARIAVGRGAPGLVPGAGSQGIESMPLERAPEMEVLLSLVYREAGRFHFSGEAKERASDRAVDTIVLLDEGKPFYWSAPNRRREYKEQGSPFTRFDFALPESAVAPRLGSAIGIAAVPAGERRLVKGSLTMTARCGWAELATLGEADFTRERSEACQRVSREWARRRSR